jgi:hypothetical protein
MIRNEERAPEIMFEAYDWLNHHRFSGRLPHYDHVVADMTGGDWAIARVNHRRRVIRYARPSCAPAEYAEYTCFRGDGEFDFRTVYHEAGHVWTDVVLDAGEELHGPVWTETMAHAGLYVMRFDGGAAWEVPRRANDNFCTDPTVREGVWDDIYAAFLSRQKPHAHQDENGEFAVAETLPDYNQIAQASLIEGGRAVAQVHQKSTQRYAEDAVAIQHAIRTVTQIGLNARVTEAERAAAQDEADQFRNALNMVGSTLVELDRARADARAIAEQRRAGMLDHYAAQEDALGRTLDMFRQVNAEMESAVRYRAPQLQGGYTPPPHIASANRLAVWGARPSAHVVLPERAERRQTEQLQSPPSHPARASLSSPPPRPAFALLASRKRVT